MSLFLPLESFRIVPDFVAVQVGGTTIQAGLLTSRSFSFRAFPSRKKQWLIGCEIRPWLQRWARSGFNRIPFSSVDTDT